MTCEKRTYMSLGILGCIARGGLMGMALMCLRQGRKKKDCTGERFDGHAQEM